MKSSGGRDFGPGGSRPYAAGSRPGPGNRGAAPGAADSARLTSIIEPVLHAMDIDLEAVKVAAAGRRRVLRIIVDADGGVSLDDIAEVSREVSARLDAKNVMGDAPYTLEVSSPGIDRPLTQPRHWRRATGRLVVVPLQVSDHDSQRGAPDGPAELAARVIGADEDGVTLEIDGARRTVGYGELGPGRVQVEFGRLPEADYLDEIAAADDLDDSEESRDDPDEEEPDGY
ncbi:MAG TPA: ribosome maturation factor RimP [Streptosporangiaceae bacterium]